MRRYMKDDGKLKCCETERISKGDGLSCKEMESKRLRSLIWKQKLAIHDKLSNKQSITRLHIKQSIKQNREKRKIGISKGQVKSSRSNYGCQRNIGRQISSSKIENNEQCLGSYRYQSMDINDQIKINRNEIICRYKTLESERSSSRNLRVYGSNSRLKRCENEKLKQKQNYQKQNDFLFGRERLSSDEMNQNRQAIVCSARQLKSRKILRYESLLTQRENKQQLKRICRGDRKNRRILTEISQGYRKNEGMKIVDVCGNLDEDKNRDGLKMKRILTPQKLKTRINSECNSVISSIVGRTKDKGCSINISRFNQESILQNIQQIDKLLDCQSNKENNNQQVNNNNSNNNNNNNSNSKIQLNVQYKKIKEKSKLKKGNEMDCFSCLEFIPMIPSVKMQVNNSRKNCRLSKNNPIIMKSIDKIRHIFPKGFFYQNNIQQILN